MLSSLIQVIINPFSERREDKKMRFTFKKDDLITCINKTDGLTNGKDYCALNCHSTMKGTEFVTLISDSGDEYDYFCTRFILKEKKEEKINFKKGDIAICVDSSMLVSPFKLTKGYTYHVQDCDTDGNGEQCIEILDDNGRIRRFWEKRFVLKEAFCTNPNRFDKMSIIKRKAERISFMTTLREYFNKNKETFITVALIAVLDEFLLGGSLRERIKSICNTFLTKTENALKGPEK